MFAPRVWTMIVNDAAALPSSGPGNRTPVAERDR